LFKEENMQFKDVLSNEEKLRIVQELVPGKQVTLAHVIANPDPIMYRKLGLNPAVDYSKNAIGIVCITPAESAIVFADIALKASGAEIGFVDRFSGTLILLGTVSEVSTSIESVIEYAEKTLKFTVCNLTKT
jgi:ethanolamine utilization protein EutS